MEPTPEQVETLLAAARRTSEARTDPAFAGPRRQDTRRRVLPAWVAFVPVPLLGLALSAAVGAALWLGYDRLLP